MSWYSFRAGKCPSDQSLDSATCYMSPEVFEFLQNETESDSLNFVFYDTDKIDIVKTKVLKVKRIKDYEKNRVYIQGCPDDSVIKLSPVENIATIPSLTRVRLSCLAENSSQEQLCLDKITSSLPVPILEGRQLFDDVQVVSAFPFRQGLLTENTDIQVEFQPHLDQVDDAEKNFTKHRGLLQYSWTLAASPHSRSLIKTSLFESYKTWLQNTYSYELKELPSSVFKSISKEHDHLSSSHICVLFSDDPKRLGSWMGQFKTIKESTLPISIPFVCSPFVPREEKAIFLTSACRQNLGLKFGSMATQPILFDLELSQTTKSTAKLEVKALQNYREISDAQIDSLLAEYFSSEKLVKFQEGKTILEIDVKDNIVTEETECLLWTAQNLPESLVFQIEHESKGDQCNRLFRICSKYSTLSRRKATGRPIPSVSKLATELNANILDILPPSLMNKVHELANLTRYSDNILVYGSKGCGKSEVVHEAAGVLGLKANSFDCRLILSDTSGATEAKLRQVFDHTRDADSPCILILTNVHVLAKNRDGNKDHRVLSALEECLNNSGMIVVGMADQKSSIDPGLASVFKTHFPLESKKLFATRNDRKLTLEWLIRAQDRQLHDESGDDVLDRVAVQASGFSFKDLEAVVDKAIWHSYDNKEEGLIVDPKVFGFPKLSEEDFNFALDEMQAVMSDAIGAPKIPEVKWEDVGGLHKAKQEILDTIQTPMFDRDLQPSGLSRSGILMYGPPGVGKTLLAKAVATECKLNFLSVKGPELLNMYVGESESNVREVFARATSAAPCIIFFDELDALAPKRGVAGDSGGVMDRVVSQLLAELDAVAVANAGDKPIFVIGATNRPDLVDPALLRPGRFDRLVYIGPPEDRGEQTKILAALTRKFRLQPEDLDLGAVVDDIKAAGLSLTGADFYALTVDAMMAAIEREVGMVENGNKEIGDAEITLTMDDFRTALIKLSPSVPPEDLAYYKSVQESIQWQRVEKI